MNGIRIRLLGGLGFFREDVPLPGITTNQARRLFAFLVLNRDQVLHRDVLCGALWGDHSDAAARKALRSALWRIRSVLEPRPEDRGTYIRADGDHLSFPGSGAVWVDVSEFEKRLADIAPGPDGELPPDQSERLRGAVALYRGDLLDGMYDECFDADRERLRLAYLMALERLLADHQARQQWTAAIETGREILRCDPLREHVHRSMMVSHLGRGDRSSALRQFEVYDAVVREELGVRPLPEIRDLYLRIRESGGNGEVHAVDQRGDDRAVDRGAVRHPLSSDIDDALRSLRQLVARLEAMRSVSEPQ